MTFVGMKVVRIYLQYVVGAVTVQSTRKHKKPINPLSWLTFLLVAYTVLTYKFVINMILNTDEYQSAIACEKCSKNFLKVIGCVKNASLLRNLKIRSKVKPK